MERNGFDNEDDEEEEVVAAEAVVEDVKAEVVEPNLRKKGWG